MTPANEIPEIVGQRRGAKLAICNLQETPLDELSDLRVHSTADDLMNRVMKKLDIRIPTFILHRHLVVDLKPQGDGRHQFTVSGVDIDNTPVTFLKSVKSEHNRRVARSEPFIVDFRGDLDAGVQLKLELEFMGHYGEPNLEIVHDHHMKDGSRTLYLLEYDPHTGAWKTSKEPNSQTAVGDGTHDDVAKEEDGAKMMSVQDASMPNNAKPTPVANSIPEAIEILE